MQVKLVRDHCPATVAGECSQAVTDEEYQMALLLKLHEEAQEIARAVHDPEEYADLLEVLIALADHNNVTEEDILSAFVSKRERKGGFGKRQIWVEEPRKTIDPDMQFDFGFFPSHIQSSSLPKWLRTTMLGDSR